LDFSFLKWHKTESGISSFFSKYLCLNNLKMCSLKNIKDVEYLKLLAEEKCAHKISNVAFNELNRKSEMFISWQLKFAC